MAPARPLASRVGARAPYEAAVEFEAAKTTSVGGESPKWGSRETAKRIRRPEGDYPPNPDREAAATTFYQTNNRSNGIHRTVGEQKDGTECRANLIKLRVY